MYKEVCRYICNSIYSIKLTPKLAPIPKKHQNFMAPPKTADVDLTAFRSW